MKLRFIPPALPQTRPGPPRGEQWLHEPKLDGWRVQAHKDGRRVTLHTRRGLDCTRRFEIVAAAVASLPAVTAILDGEVVALDGEGKPDFVCLHHAERTRLVYHAFDLLHLDGVNVRDEPLVSRKELLALQLGRHRHPLVREVPGFDDGERLFAEAERRQLEGIVTGCALPLRPPLRLAEAQDPSLARDQPLAPRVVQGPGLKPTRTQRVDRSSLPPRLAALRRGCEARPRRANSPPDGGASGEPIL